MSQLFWIYLYGISPRYDETNVENYKMHNIYLLTYTLFVIFTVNENIETIFKMKQFWNFYSF